MYPCQEENNVGAGFMHPRLGRGRLPDLRTRKPVSAKGVERSDDVGLGSLSGGQAAGGPARAASVPSDHQPTHPHSIQDLRTWPQRFGKSWHQIYVPVPVWH